MRTTAAAAEERRIKDGNEKKNEWHKQLNKCINVLKILKDHQSSLAKDIEFKIKCLSDKRCDVKVIAPALKNLNNQQAEVMK